MAKNEEKLKVGRPKLADSELIKDSWFKIGASLVIVFMLIICGVGVLTNRTPLQVLTFQKSESLKANVVQTNQKEDSKNVKIIPANKTITRIINADGTVTKLIPAQ